jgi:hypothetical protein
MSDEPVEETLAWEAEQGPRAAVAAAIAAIGTLVGGIVSSTALSDQPHVPLTTSLQNAARPGADTRPSLRTDQLEYLHDKAGTLILGGIVLAIGYFALLPAIGYLYRAAKARRPELPRATIILGLIGPALLGVAAIVFQIALTTKAGDFAASSNHTRAAVDDVTKGGLLRGVQVLNLPGTLCLAFALVLLSLNAMRVGLLTRFMGVLGIICARTRSSSSGCSRSPCCSPAAGRRGCRPRGRPAMPSPGRRLRRSRSNEPLRAAMRQLPKPSPTNCQKSDRTVHIRPRASASASAVGRQRSVPGYHRSHTHRNERGSGWRLPESRPRRVSTAIRLLG